jgi:dTDP-4-dehydrorhamnose 3,5-epimerase
MSGSSDSVLQTVQSLASDAPLPRQRSLLQPASAFTIPSGRADISYRIWETNMIFTPLPLPGAYLIQIAKLQDARGFFGRAWCRREFALHGLNATMAQCNLSHNRRKGTLRGMHYQAAPHQEAKLVRCTHGAIFDVLIDLRPESPTFRRWHAVVLSRDNYAMVYVPEGFAHGYQCLEDDTEVFYQVSEFYDPEIERGVRWNDPAFAISWPLADVVLSEKDQRHPDFVHG